MSFSLSQKHIIVNYHYVEDPREDRKGIHPCSIDEFERQIAFLSKHFRIGSIEDVFTAAQSKSSEKICALTFDDGLKDQYINTVPILKKYKASATFFIITGTLEGIVPATHKVHILLSQYKSDKLVDMGNKFLGQEYPALKDQYYIPKDRRLSDERALRDDIATANFKETITVLPKEIKNHLLNWLCESEKNGEKGMAYELFMEKKDIQNLYASGFWIGSHTHSHEALDTLQKDEMYNTIRLSKKLLEQLIGASPTLFCYPHGSASGIAPACLQEEGFTYAVTTEQRVVDQGDTPFLIPRYDTNAIRDFLNQITKEYE